MRYAFAFFLVLFVSFVSLILCHPGGATDTNLSLELSLDRDSMSIAGNFSQSTLVIFKGSLLMSGPVSEYLATVYLTCQNKTGWVIAPIPSTIILEPDELETFYVQVIVPPRMPMGSHTLNIIADLYQNDSTIQVSRALTVIIDQYYQCDVDLDRYKYDIRPDSIVKGTLRIMNTGNGIDSFRMIVADESGCLANWEATLSGTVLANASTTINFTLWVIDEDLPGREFYIGLEVFSMGAEEHDIPLLEYDENRHQTTISLSSLGWVADRSWSYNLFFLSLLVVVVLIVLLVLWRYGALRRDR